MANGNGRKEATLSEFEQLGTRAANDLLQTTRGISRAGLQYDGNRQIDQVLGYKENPGPDDYREYYDSRAIASVIVDRPAHDTWRKPPEVKDGSGGDSQFMKDWETLVDNYKVFHYLERLDRLSGIGRYGTLLLGFKDENDQDFSREVSNPSELLYLTPFWEGKAEINEFETELNEKRFGKPTEYEINLASDVEGFDLEGNNKRDVHYSRVLHVAEGLLDNEVYGEPRLQKVFNRLFDLDKLIGAAPEGFWQQAAKGYHLDEKEGADLGSEEIKDIKGEFQDFINGFRRAIASSGVDVKELTGEVSADPSNPFDIVISVISAKTGIPKRILTGSEQAELASSQDRKNWFDQVEERRQNFAGPMILEALIDRLVDYGIIKAPYEGSYDIEWPNLWSPTAMEEANIMAKKAKALKDASGGMPRDLMDKPVILEEIFGLDPGEIEDVSEEELNLDEENEQVQEQFLAAQQ